MLPQQPSDKEFQYSYYVEHLDEKDAQIASLKSTIKRVEGVLGKIEEMEKLAMELRGQKYIGHSYDAIHKALSICREVTQ